MKSLADVYKEKAFECKALNDDFGYHYWMTCAFDVECMQ